MIIRNISNPIQETLKARERALARKTAAPNASTEEGTLHYGDLATRSTFVTMASANGFEAERRIISQAANKSQIYSVLCKKTDYPLR